MGVLEGGKKMKKWEGLESQSWFLVMALLLSLQETAARISVISEINNCTLGIFHDLPARYVPDRFSFFELQGYLIYSNPPDACTAVQPPPNKFPPSASDPEYPISWILLARRSPNCHFQRKIENAQKAGFNAIIVHNVGSNSTEVMGAEDPSNIIIYATFIGEYDALVLLNYTYGSGYFIRIEDNFTISGYLLPFAVVIGACFVIMVVFMVVLWARERRRSRRRKLSSSALKKIPVLRWGKGDPFETCAICLEDFLEGERIRVLPCSHGFHMVCIDPWLTKGRRVCPICKRKVVVPDEGGRDSDPDTDDEAAPLLRPTPSTSSTNPPQVIHGEETFVLPPPVPCSSSSTPAPQVHTLGRRRFDFVQNLRTEPPELGSDNTSQSSVNLSELHVIPHSVFADIHTPELEDGRGGSPLPRQIDIGEELLDGSEIVVSFEGEADTSHLVFA